jgi:hypothetical protein
MEGVRYFGTTEIGGNNGRSSTVVVCARLVE